MDGDTVDLQLLGVAVDLSARYLVTESLAVEAFFLYTSGDGNLVNGESSPTNTYNSFVGVVPYSGQGDPL